MKNIYPSPSQEHPHLSEGTNEHQKDPASGDLTPQGRCGIYTFYKDRLKQNGRWIRIVSVWLVVSFVIGAIISFFVPEFLEEIISAFQDKFGEDPELNFNLVKAIFIQNTFVSLVSLFGGLLLGLGPLLAVTLNGFLIGFITFSVISISDVGLTGTLLFLLLAMLPHGILEIPAIIIASSLGLRLGINWTSIKNKENRWQIFKSDLKLALWFLPLIIFLLFAAALAEVFITGNIVG
ncbi:MAG: stage II sporulation protein M [bacterium]|nr:stage II sporulation protein M [bacterium]